MNTPTASEHLLKSLDQCVVCGLCIPHCPTYPISQREGDSPRGRIALMQGLISDKLDDVEHATDAIDRCVGCRACETVCPAKVPYGAALAEFRLIGPSRERKAGMGERLAKSMRRHPLVMRAAGIAARLALRIPNRRFKTSRLGRLARYAAGPLRKTKAPQGPVTNQGAKGSVVLFPGCVVPAMAPATVTAAQTLLNRLGYGVVMPRRTTCCGALNLSEGDLPGMTRNLGAVDKLAADHPDSPIVSLAAGCSSQVQLYPSILPLEGAPLAWTARFTDFMVFVEQALAATDCRFVKSDLKVAVHEPCSLRHGLKQTGITERVLKVIPGIQLTALPRNAPCCGAGGSTLLSHPEIADPLAQNTVDALLAMAPDVIVSANIGCAMHLQAELRRRGNPVAVVHPVEILADALSD